jgi:hypothetical protein
VLLKLFVAFALPLCLSAFLSFIPLAHTRWQLGRMFLSLWIIVKAKEKFRQSTLTFATGMAV